MNPKQETPKPFYKLHPGFTPRDSVQSLLKRVETKETQSDILEVKISTMMKTPQMNSQTEVVYDKKFQNIAPLLLRLPIIRNPSGLRSIWSFNVLRKTFNGLCQ